MVLLACALSARADQLPLSGETKAVAIDRRGIRDAAAHIAAVHTTNALTHDQKLALWRDWQSFLDYLLSLDSLRVHSSDFAVSYSAFLAEYRGALEMIDAADAIPSADKIFNDAVPEIGLPANTYAQMRLRFLNVARATDYAALAAKWHATSYLTPLQTTIDEDSKFILDRGKGRGELKTVENAAAIVRHAIHTAYFPAQKNIAEWMGDTKVARTNRSLINERQVNALAKKLEPGDVMLERREWYLSNAGLPGYWPHTALYIGNAADRRRDFGDEFESKLATKYPIAYSQSNGKQVIEAMSEGVVFTTNEHSLSADSLAVLRPRVTKEQKAIAIERAFHYAGRPYDFDFDFDTDASLVCSELVYRAYESALHFPLVTVLARQTLPPNIIAKQFDATYATRDQQFDLVAFLDGNERAGIARNATVQTFRSSWHRPKWHIVTAK